MHFKNSETPFRCKVELETLQDARSTASSAARTATSVFPRKSTRSAISGRARDFIPRLVGELQALPLRQIHQNAREHPLHAAEPGEAERAGLHRLPRLSRHLRASARSAPPAQSAASGATPKEYDIYAKSVHGNALFNEHNQDVPVCVDCHTAHTIEDPFSLDYRERIPEMCSNCHARKEIVGQIRPLHGRRQDLPCPTSMA